MYYGLNNNSVKGKITELVFEQMFRDQKEFEVLHHGYEYTNPEIAQNLQNLDKEHYKNIRHQPDFILLSWKGNKKFLVEVKYRTIFNEAEIIKIARELANTYEPCYLFIATPEKFYFNSCTEILEKGTIAEMSETWIPKLVQEKYLRSLNKYKPE